MKFKSLILTLFFFLFTISAIEIQAGETKTTEKIKARYSFKKGRKNQEVLDKLAKGFA